MRFVIETFFRLRTNRDNHENDRDRLGFAARRPTAVIVRVGLRISDTLLTALSRPLCDRSNKQQRERCKTN